jgi:hypothetical protein
MNDPHALQVLILSVQRWVDAHDGDPRATAEIAEAVRQLRAAWDQFVDSSVDAAIRNYLLRVAQQPGDDDVVGS